MEKNELVIRPNLVGFIANLFSFVFNLGCIIILLAVAFAALGGLYYMIFNDFWRFDFSTISIIAIVLVLVSVPFLFYVWKNTYYVISPGSVLVREGFRTRSYKGVEPKYINLKQNALMGMLGYGHVDITYFHRSVLIDTDSAEKVDTILLKYIPSPHKNEYISRIDYYLSQEMKLPVEHSVQKSNSLEP